MGLLFSNPLKRKQSIDDDYQPRAKRIRLKSTSEYICEKLFKNGEGSDVVIESFGKEWKLHKLYLSQSPYFQSMFSQGWVESKSHRIPLNISDENINEQAFSLAIETLYNDNIQINITQAPSLLATARWFNMDELFNQCALIMMDNIRLENVINICKYAILYGANDLSETCIHFLGNRIMFLKNDIEYLKQINPKIMKLLIACNNLCVHLAEINVYFMLRRWLYLLINVDNEIVDCEKAHDFFRKNYKETKEIFLEQNKYAEFVPIFAQIRYQWILCELGFYNILVRDKIVPNSWIQKSMEDNYLKILKINSSTDLGPISLNQNFLNCCWRGGRTFLNSRPHNWRFVGFNFGCDLQFYFSHRCIKIRRSVQGKTHFMDQSKIRHICYRVRLKNFDDNWNCSRKFENTFTILSMEPNKDYELINLSSLHLDFPLRVNFDILPYTATPNDASISDWRIQNICFPVLTNKEQIENLHHWDEISIEYNS